ncbi:hypothetical protein [Paenibacillus urinalis]|uniref:Tyr recombinase domain-containing protein n=1 Tax=Paenibacillus urinalis TaxID=521520 RepID=A0AAX3N3N0_9BACL|nr:hypothetical protein [Paenibacillus urinalis]WDH83295.1 hypothetical protein PUW23_03360 [Paenibacillus urinalis]
MNKNHNCINVDELKTAIKWAKENDKELLIAMFLSMIGLRSSEIISLRLN